MQRSSRGFHVEAVYSRSVTLLRAVGFIRVMYRWKQWARGRGTVAEALVQVRMKIVAEGEGWILAVVEEVEEGGVLVQGVN